MEIIIIAAMAKNRVIGKDNKLPWAIKEDMQHFKELTKGFPCIMGRKTWDSLPKKPLPGRLNIVISREQRTANSEQGAMSNEQGAMSNEYGAEVCKSLPDALERCKDFEKIFIIGGGTVYRQAMDIADKIELTLIHKDYEGDTYFPEIDPSIWEITGRTDFDNFSFITYNKIK